MANISTSLRRWRRAALGLAFATAVALLAACGTPGKNLPISETAAQINADHVQEVTVAVESFYFKPNRIDVSVNMPVRLTLTSGTHLIPHNFSLHAPEAGIDVNQDIGHGKVQIVEFTPTKSGEYQFFCDKGSHMAKGMVGTLVVRP
jgi:plastocyanin domain-containing protein